MEKQLKCVLLLSLKEMALRRVAVLLWSDSGILASLSKFQFNILYHDESETEWRETIEEKVKDKVLKLELPNSLTKQMIDIVRPIGLQINRWKVCQGYKLCSLIEKMPYILSHSVKLVWTTAGMINYRKTTEELLRCDALDVTHRYILACMHCLEDYIPLLWEELPEEKKDYFYNEILDNKSTSPRPHFFWPLILKGELSALDYLLRTEDRNLTTFNQWAFENSAYNRNKTAAEYFFQKLTHEEREASLVRTALALLENPFQDYFITEGPVDLLCYLISLMTPEQQMETIKAHPDDVLLRFFYWPWQDLFLENAGLIWTFIPPSGYGELLWKMVNGFRRSYHYFSKLLHEFFIQSPLDFRKYFVDQKSESGVSPASQFLTIFFTSEDSESIEVIFRNMDAADRVELVLHRRTLQLFYDCILTDRWPMVEVCLREAALSQEDRERLKAAFMEFFKSDDTGEIEWENQKWKRFFDFLDETNASADKEKKAQKPKLENFCSE